MDATEPAIGHNQPPEELPSSAEDWESYLARQFAEQLAIVQTIMARYERFKPYALKAPTWGLFPDGADKWDKSVAERAFLLERELAAALKGVTARHTQVKAPYLEATRMIDGFRAKHADPIDAAQRAVRASRTLWQAYTEQVARAEAEAAAEAERKRAADADADAAKLLQEGAVDAAMSRLNEAEAAEANAAQIATNAAAAAKDAATIRTVAGTGALRRTWKFLPEESDIVALCKAVAEGNAPARFVAFNTTAIGFAVRSEGLRECPGLTIRQVIG